jgi:hypothetical protein
MWCQHSAEYRFAVLADGGIRVYRRWQRATYGEFLRHWSPLRPILLIANISRPNQVLRHAPSKASESRLALSTSSSAHDWTRASGGDRRRNQSRNVRCRKVSIPDAISSSGRIGMGAPVLRNRKVHASDSGLSLRGVRAPPRFRMIANKNSYLIFASSISSAAPLFICSSCSFLRRL